MVIPLSRCRRVVMGRFCEIGWDVEVVDLTPNSDEPFVIGDCVRIGDGVRFIIGEQGVRLGDYVTLHERCLVIARGRTELGHNVWCARHVLLDGTGGLTIGNGVRIGASSQVWSHAEAGEELEGCTLNSWKETRIGEHAWLVGRVDVNPGAHIPERAVVANGSVVVRPLEVPWSLYAGHPARLVPGSAYKLPGDDARWDMFRGWLADFAVSRGYPDPTEPMNGVVELAGHGDRVVVSRRPGLTDLFGHDARTTLIDLATKQYTKRLTELEIALMRWLDGRRARFVPVPV